MEYYYKVVDENLKSLGMKPRGRAVPIIQYQLGKWTYPLEPISDDPEKGGGKIYLRSLLPKYLEKLIQKYPNLDIIYW